MNTQLPASLEEALAAPRPKPRAPLPSLLAMALLWGLSAYALHGVMWPAPLRTPQDTLMTANGLTVTNAIDLTDEVVTALAADQLGSVLLKVQLAQKVAQRLNAAATAAQPPASPATAR